MNAIGVGQPAPSFRLPAATGGDVSLDDFRGRTPVIVWFTKGMACAFCRQQMSQLARGYGRFKDLRGELLQITLTPLERARTYAQKFRLPFPYLCDPDYQVRRAWGLDHRSRSPLWYAAAMYASTKWPKPSDDFGKVPTSLAEMPKMMADDDAGLFVVDRDGIVRYASAAAYATAQGVHALPANEQLAAVLADCERQGSRA